MINLDEILVEDESAPTFYCLTNADGKCWVMPAKGMRTAMHLYQPSGAKGKLLKTLFPLLHPLPHVRRILHTRPIHYRLTAKLQALVDELFGRGAAFALFGGTPCVHQKATLQLSRDGRILGYLKLCNHPGVFQLFDHEQQILTELQQKNVTGIPRCLGCGALEDGLWYFAQSTEKTGQSRVLHDWTPLHTEFIRQLAEKSAITMPFEGTAFCEALSQLQMHLHWLPEQGRQMVTQALNEVMDFYRGKEVTFSAYHGDFTPWNMFVEQNKLFVFDWEYAQQSYPPGLDYYHYMTQSAIFERHADTEAIWQMMQPKLTEQQENRVLYMGYLLDILGRFTLREQGQAEGDELRCMQIWIELLHKLMA